MEDDVLGDLVPEADLFVHTGDVVDGASYPAEDATALPWLHQMARGSRSLVAVGNHDLRDRAVHTVAEWERIYRRSANSFEDVKGIRFAAFAGPDSFTGDATPWIVPSATWDWLDGIVSSAPGPVVLVDHYPPAELGGIPENYLQPMSTFDTFVGDHPNVIGMLCGHMHFGLADPNAATFQSIGGRMIPVLCDISSMLSDITGRDQSAQMQSYSAYVTMREDRWEIRYRAHGTHAWSGPADQRVTTLDLSGHTVTRGM